MREVIFGRDIMHDGDVACDGIYGILEPFDDSNYYLYSIFDSLRLHLSQQ